jgi:hypothetical protein
VRRLLVILVVLLTTGCSEPPQKEIDQAQAAVDAARTAGADRYAAADFTAAVSSLDKARAAVEQRDYRQALNYALDSRQRAVTPAVRRPTARRARVRPSTPRTPRRPRASTPCSPRCEPQRPPRRRRDC